MDATAAANRCELETLIVNLSGDTALSGMGTAALLDAYIGRLESRCSDIRGQIAIGHLRLIQSKDVAATLGQAWGGTGGEPVPEEPGILPV